MGDAPRQEAGPVKHQYGEHDLQSLSVWSVTSPEVQHDNPSFWIIYVHGGAWRDPKVTQESIIPALRVLLSEPKYAHLLPSISAVASIDYRLSAHPAYPQDPTTTPATAYRNAKHPDHIIDVKTAIKFLQDTYGFGEKYLLVGHSCGATLAFQAVLGTSVLSNHADIPIQTPAGIAGVCGIYDINKMLVNHGNSEGYREFCVGAFGEDEQLWDVVSPSVRKEYSQWAQVSEAAAPRVFVLASSPDDGLVEDEQTHDMAVVGPAALERAFLYDLRGAHNEIWEKGTELAIVIGDAVGRLGRVARGEKE